MFLVNQHVLYFFIQIFSLKIDVVTTERISPDCPFKIIQRQVKISIVTPRNGVCLCDVMHTAEIVCGGMRTVETSLCSNISA